MTKPDTEQQSGEQQQLDGMIISDTSIRQPVFITMLMLLVIVVGFLSYRTMPVDLFPEISPPIVNVSVIYPGAGPESVAEQVGEPLEDELSTLNGVAGITSTAAEGSVQVVVEFEQEVDPVQALQDVRDRVELIRPQLPQDIQEPVFQRFDPAQSPILTMAITSNTDKNPAELRERVEDDIVPLVQVAPGVGSVSVSGGLERQINVQLDLTRLTALRILPAQVSRAIDGANANRGLGDIGMGSRDVNLRAPSTLDEPADIAEVGIPGTSYTVADVATIEDGYADVDTYSRLNGIDSITLAVRKQSGTNTVTVANAAMEQVEEAFAANPDLSYVLVRDESDLVQQNVNGAVEEIIFAILFALLVVFIFFRDLRNTIVTGSGLPVIIIGTFALINYFGLTINIITLLALSVTVGLVIDDAIVVRENIFRHMERGENPRIAASRGTAQVALAVVAMTLTIIAVFLPVAFTTGVTGIIFGSFGITVACAMVLSLLEAFTLAPMLSAYWFKQKKVDHSHHVIPEGEEHLPAEAHEDTGWMGRQYERLLGWALRRRFVTLLIGVGVVFASITAAQGMQVAFFPEDDTGEFGVGFELPPGTPLEVTERLARDAEDILLADPDIGFVVTSVGGAGSSMFGGSGGDEYAEFYVKLREEEAEESEGFVQGVASFFTHLFAGDSGPSTDEVQARLREQMPESQFPEIVFSKSNFMGTSTDVASRPIQALLRTTGDLDDLAPVIPQLVAAVEDVPGLTDVDTSYTPGKPEVQFLLQPGRANDFGISNNDMARTLRALVDGDTASVFRDDDKNVDIVVRLEASDRQDLAGLRSLRVPLNGQLVPLAQIADITLESSPTTIRRTDKQVEVIIGGNNTGRNINEVQADMQARLETVPLPEDVSFSFGGNTEDQAESFATIGIAMALSVIFVYMVLASQFGSFLQPLVIMLAMPLSFIGAFVALRLTGIELTLFGMIGMVLLLGLVTKNSILLVDFVNRLYRAGLEKNRAIIRAGGVRLRPILMTSIAIMLANMPAAIGFGEGAELRRGLATIVIGGLITSTLLTLLFVPVAYSLLESAIRRVRDFGGWLARLRPTMRKQKGSDDAAPEPPPESYPERPAVGPPSDTQPGTAFKYDDPGEV